MRGKPRWTPVHTYRLKCGYEISISIDYNEWNHARGWHKYRVVYQRITTNEEDTHTDILYGKTRREAFSQLRHRLRYYTDPDYQKVVDRVEDRRKPFTAIIDEDIEALSKYVIEAASKNIASKFDDMAMSALKGILGTTDTKDGENKP
jgi:hypothetical protein